MQTSSLKEEIWQIVAAIPKGNVATYGQIARYVGTTLRNLPNDTLLPWHRVVNGKGQLSFPFNSQPWREQKSRLEAEGIVFTGKGFSLKVFQWQT